MSAGALRPVPRLGSAISLLRLMQIAVLAALAIVGRIAFLWAPNFALTYYVVFFAGVLLGARAGAGVAIIAMTATNLVLTGLSPVLLANTTAMALLGILGGLARPLILADPRTRTDRLFRRTLLFTCGLFGTLLFSVASDLLGFVVQFVVIPEGATIGSRALVPLLLAGLVFNLAPAVMNAALFALATPPLIEALRAAGHVPAPTRPRTRPAADTGVGDDAPAKRPRDPPAPGIRAG